jgi:dihydropteroate synthase
LRNIRVLADLGPVLIGTSRKSFLGKLTGRDVDRREFATASTVALSIAGGAAMVRVHDVANLVDVVRVADAWCHASDG